jgi:hypothetical protein
LGETGGQALSMTISIGSVSVNQIVSPKAEGRISSTLVIAIFTAGCMLFTSQRAGHHVGERLQ